MTPRRWAVFEDEDHTFGIVVEGDGDNLVWPEMNDVDCQRVVDEHNALVEARADALREAAEMVRELVAYDDRHTTYGDALVPQLDVLAVLAALEPKP